MGWVFEIWRLWWFSESPCFNQNSTCPLDRFPFVHFSEDLTFVRKPSRRVEFPSPYPTPGGSSPFCFSCSLYTFFRSWKVRFCSREDFSSPCSSQRPGEPVDQYMSHPKRRISWNGKGVVSERHMAPCQSANVSSVPLGVVSTTHGMDEYSTDFPEGHLTSKKEPPHATCVQCELSAQCLGHSRQALGLTSRVFGKEQPSRSSLRDLEGQGITRQRRWKFSKKNQPGTSLVVRWLSICLAM